MASSSHYWPVRRCLPFADPAGGTEQALTRSVRDYVVITGVGCIGPLGECREVLWRGLLEGELGVRSLTQADFHGLWDCCTPTPPFVGAPACYEGMSAGDEPVLFLIGSAADEALRHSQLTPGDFDPDRAGCVIGTSKGGLVSMGKSLLAQRQGTESTAAWPLFMPHTASSQIAARWSLKGPCLSPVAACATGLVSVIRGAALIREGLCDVVVAGSGDASIHPAVLGSFRRMGVLSSRFDEARFACRPFNRDRHGFAVGEGAAIFVLERRSHAEARRASVLASFLGGSVLSDSTGMTAVDERGESLARAVREALASAGLGPDQVGHINLHGTATTSNDVAEWTAMRTVFGAAMEKIPAVALKGALGHLLGAAGAIELAGSVLAIRDRVSPPTATLTELDPHCSLRLSRKPMNVSGCGLKVSLGFGGHVAAALLGPGDESV